MQMRVSAMACIEAGKWGMSHTRRAGVRRRLSGLLSAEGAQEVVAFDGRNISPHRVNA